MRLLTRGIIMTLALLLMVPNIALAYDETQRRDLELRPFWDKTDTKSCEEAAPANTPSADGSGTGAASGKVYVIGDSITEGTQPELTSALKAKGFSTVVINGKSSRRLSSGATNLDGISVLAADKAQWSDAKNIIIELGTNNGVTAVNIDKVIAILKGAPAQVSWVNIGVDNTRRKGSPIPADQYNAVLQANSSKGYSVIDWATAVKQHPDYIDPNPTTGLGVHPFTATGKPGFANTVANGVAGSSTDNANTQNLAPEGCTAGGSNNNAGSTSGGDLSGNDNAQKIFNYLSCKGLSAIQVAGIMGNLQAESGFNPGVEEKTPRRSKGYGLAQWTFGRRDALEAAARARGVAASDLAFQLDFLWGELTGPYKKRVYDPIKATSSLETATYVFLEHFEIPADISGNKPVRLGFAQNILKQSWAKDGGNGCNGK